MSLTAAIERLRYALKMHDEHRTTLQSLASSVGDFLRDYANIAAGQPKPAGAVPLPKMIGMIGDRPICFQDQVARYGDAREAAAHAIPRELCDWLTARDLLPEPEEDGSVNMIEIIGALDRHENELLAAGRAVAVPEGYCLMPMKGTPEIFTAMRMSVGDGVAMGPVYYAALSAGAIAAPTPQQPAAEGAGRETVAWVDGDSISDFMKGPAFNGQNFPVTLRHSRAEGDVALYTRPTPAADAGGVTESRTTGTVADISDADLLRRAIRYLAPRSRGQPAWARIGKVFALGSTYAGQLCQRFNIDPKTGKSLTQEVRRGE